MECKHKNNVLMKQPYLENVLLIVAILGHTKKVHTGTQTMELVFVIELNSAGDRQHKIKLIKKAPVASHLSCALEVTGTSGLSKNKVSLLP